MASYIGRRKFLATLGRRSRVAPRGARAAPAMPVVGFGNAGSSDPPLAAAFRKGLNEAGYFEGQNRLEEVDDEHCKRMQEPRTSSAIMR